MLNESDTNKKIIAAALKNLRYAGLKRNRGFGEIRCEVISRRKLDMQKVWNSLFISENTSVKNSKKQANQKKGKNAGKQLVKFKYRKKK